MFKMNRNFYIFLSSKQKWKDFFRLLIQNLFEKVLFKFFLIWLVMKMNLKKIKLSFFLTMFCLITSAFIAYGFQNDFGNVKVTNVIIAGLNGDEISGKLRGLKFVFNPIPIIA